MQYRLDKETAVVLVSAVEINDDNKERTFIIEHMTKVQDWETLKASRASAEKTWRCFPMPRCEHSAFGSRSAP